MINNKYIGKYYIEKLQFKININCIIIHKKRLYCTYQLVIKDWKHQESGYCDEARLTSNYYFSKWHQFHFCHLFLCAHNPSPVNGRVQILTINKTWIHGIFLEFKGGVDTGEGFW